MKANSRNLRAKRAPKPSGGRSHADLTSHTAAQGAHGYVWRLSTPAGRAPRNPETGRKYRACPKRPKARIALEDARTLPANW